MEKREHEILDLQKFTKSAETEIAMILQSLQWDINTLKQKPESVFCKYDKHHSVSAEVAETHERKCFYKYSGYSMSDQLLPDLDDSAMNAVRLSQEEINKIIHEASVKDPSFKTVVSYLCPELEHYLQCRGDPVQPMSLERLQCTYTADERRAIYDAVVATKTATSDPFDVSMLNEDGSKSTRNKGKSRLELEAELRDMKRRRVRYRGACPDSNYSHVLRGVIEAQMESYTNVIKKEDVTIERKPKHNTEDHKSDKDLKSSRATYNEFRVNSVIKSNQPSNYDYLNTVYDKDRKRKHESRYNSKVEKFKRVNSKDYDDRHHSNRAEKYEFDSVKSSRVLQSHSSKYSEHRSKHNSSRESYDAYKKRKPHSEMYDKSRHQESHSKERKNYSYTYTQREKREKFD